MPSSKVGNSQLLCVLNVYCVMKHRFSCKNFCTFSKYASINKFRLLAQSLEDAQAAQKF